MEGKDYFGLWLPKELGEKLKIHENEEGLIEKEVIRYIEDTKTSITQSVENLDEDVLMFKGKLASYKLAFKEAYNEADDNMYSFWEKFDENLSKKYKSLSSRMDNINKIYEKKKKKKKHQIKSLSDSMNSINTYQFEKVIGFLKSFQNLDNDTKELFKDLMIKE